MNHFLSKFLYAYWLRPETALWRSVDAQLLSEIEFKDPALDLGCGDGVFSFLAHGGEFTSEFDIFEGADPKGFWQNKDIYDFYPENFSPKIVKYPKFIFEVGFDIKENLLKKAKTLGIYKKTICGDATKPLPFPSNHFATVFSNILYWLPNLEEVLKEITRILKPKGKFITTVPTETWFEYLFCYEIAQKLEKKGHKTLAQIFYKLDRGRHSSYQHFYSPEKWLNYFRNAELFPIFSKRYLSRPLMRFWDIGLRPLSPYTIPLSKLLGKLKLKTLVKIPFVFFWSKLLKSYAIIDHPLDKKFPPAFLLIVAQKNEN